MARRTLQGSKGMTLVEILLAIAFLSVALVALVSTISIAYVNVASGGTQSKVTAYARQQVEMLKNQPFNPGPVSGSDTPEVGMTRSWTIAPVGATTPPNRLARITVTVTSIQNGQTASTANVVLETMRAE